MVTGVVMAMGIRSGCGLEMPLVRFWVLMPNCD